jgi:hypothetical protein
MTETQMVGLAEKTKIRPLVEEILGGTHKHTDIIIL